MKTIRAEKLRIGLVNGAISLITESGNYLSTAGLKIDTTDPKLPTIDVSFYIGHNVNFNDEDIYTTLYKKEKEK